MPIQKAPNFLARVLQKPLSVADESFLLAQIELLPEIVWQSEYTVLQYIPKSGQSLPQWSKMIFPDLTLTFRAGGAHYFLLPSSVLPADIISQLTNHDPTWITYGTCTYTTGVAKTLTELGLLVRVNRVLGLLVRSNEDSKILNDRTASMALLAHSQLSYEDKEQLLRLRLQPLVADKTLQRCLMAFYRSNQSLGRAAKLLKIHRNTLIYRLKKIHQLTGYDVTNFQAASQLYLCYVSYQFLSSLY